MKIPFEPGERRWSKTNSCYETFQEDGEWLLDKQVLASDLEREDGDELSELFGSADYGDDPTEFQLFDEHELND